MLVTCAHESAGAIFGITITSCKVFRFQMNEYVLVNYNVSIRRDNDLAINITRRLNFPGAENLYTSRFK